ncbi:MAG: glycoside hydrolase family 13 protein [Treponema sp.]|nr:glycoside hydrolase family 13 protein [Treponema sp.]
MPQVFPVFEHRAALPWCCYDIKRNKIIFRLLCPDDTEKAALIWGDPFDRHEGRWRYAEAALNRRFLGISSCIWQVEIDRPSSRRLKYGFRVKTPGGEYYFCENGIEPYEENALHNEYGQFFFPFVHEADAPQEPEWVEKTIWYQIFPERFYRKMNENAVSPHHIEDWETGKPHFNNFFGGNLAGIREKLPWLADLGINGLYLTPVFTSPSNHKYNTTDYFSVDPHFGNTHELKTLVAEAHALNIRVMLDAVFNHAGDTHPFWQDVRANQEQSPYRDYFRIRRFPVRQPAHNPRDLDYHTYAWVQHMPKWNTEHPAARKYLLDCAAYWIQECDIDGWRLDVASEVSFDFWKDFTRLVRSLKKDIYILSEIWHDASPWINAGLFDANMNYPLGYAVSDCFIEKKISPEVFTQRLFAALSIYSNLHNRMSFNLLDSHDTDRVLTRAHGDKKAIKNAFTMLFLLPGAPCLYYGTEIGMEGFRDPDCRRPMIWNEARQDNNLRRFFQELISFRRKFISIINDSVVLYKKEGDVHCWEFSNSGGTLIAAYTEAAAVRDFRVPGSCVFGPEPVLNDYETGELPPYSLVVFQRRSI